MKRGKPTKVPGVYRDGSDWIVRATVRSGVKTKERERRLQGTKDDAQRALVDLKAEMKAELAAEKEAKAKPRPPEEKTDGEFVADWLHAKRTMNARMKEAAVENIVQRVERFIMLWLEQRKHLSLATLEDTDILDDWCVWLAQLKQPAKMGYGPNKRAGMQYSKSTLQSAWKDMRSLIAFVSRRMKRPNPMNGLRFAIETKTPPRQKQAATQEEMRAIVQAARFESRDIRMMIVLEVQLGCRFCEVSALEWSDINLDEGWLDINRSQNEGEVGEVKTAATRRRVFLLPKVVEQLRSYQLWQLESEVPGIEKDLVFPSRKGGYRTPSILVKPLQRCIERAGLSKHLTSHSLRRTLNSLVVAVAGDATAQVMLGHATGDTAMTRTYNVVDKKRRLEVARAALGDALDDPGSDEPNAIH
jgi:integrase